MDPSNISIEKIKELLDAQAHIWNNLFGFLNSMSLKCALELGIPEAIHNHGKPMTITELANALDIHPTKAPSLYRLMRVLCHSHFFSRTERSNRETTFNLTINSQLLLKSHPISLAPLVLMLLNSTMIEPSQYLERWFKNEEDTPFHIAHGRSLWEQANLVPKLNNLLNEGMANDSRFIATLLLANNESKAIFEGIETLVDVGGGNGTMAKAIASTYPGLKCIVFDLPHVVEGYAREHDGGNLVYVGGDMFETIPHANAILLKWILHDWDDEHCIKILKRSKEAILSKDQGGKVIIIDVVMKNQNNNMKQLEAQILSDMEMMSLYGLGRERTEEEWKKLFLNAGFNDYKIYPILGFRSVIEIYP